MKMRNYKAAVKLSVLIFGISLLLFGCSNGGGGSNGGGTNFDDGGGTVNPNQAPQFGGDYSIPFEGQDCTGATSAGTANIRITQNGNRAMLQIGSYSAAYCTVTSTDLQCDDQIKDKEGKEYSLESQFYFIGSTLAGRATLTIIAVDCALDIIFSPDSQR